MSSSNTPPNSADQEDPWEQLADLVGLEGGKEYAGSSPSPAASNEPPVATPVPAIHQSTGQQSTDQQFSEVASQPAAPADNSVEDRFSSELPCGLVTNVSEISEPPLAPGSPVPAAATHESAQDSYWDALANWNWDESDGGASKPKSEAGRSGGGPPPRGGGHRDRDDRRDRQGGDRPGRASSPPASSPSVSTPGRAPRPAPPAGGDDFGLGVASDSIEYSSPQDSPDFGARPQDAVNGPGGLPASAGTGPRSESSGSRGRDRQRGVEPAPGVRGEEEFPRKRRRRRRRRSRGGDREQTGSLPPPESVAPGADWDDSAGPESDFVEEPETPAVDVTANPADEPHGAPPGAPPRGRNRDRRRESTPRPASGGRSEDHITDDEHEEPQEIVMGGGATSAPAEDDGDDEMGEPVVSFENVPTWEEAISYLLHPSQVQVESDPESSARPPRGAPPPDQPRQTRHLGNRKHRR